VPSGTPEGAEAATRSSPTSHTWKGREVDGRGGPLPANADGALTGPAQAVAARAGAALGSTGRHNVHCGIDVRRIPGS